MINDMNQRSWDYIRNNAFTDHEINELVKHVAEFTEKNGLSYSTYETTNSSVFETPKTIRMVTIHVSI